MSILNKLYLYVMEKYNLPCSLIVIFSVGRRLETVKIKNFSRERITFYTYNKGETLFEMLKIFHNSE